MDLTRKEFLKLTVVFLSTAAAGCGGSDTPANPDLAGPHTGPTDLSNAGNCLQNGTASTISANHGHSITVPIFDITAGVDKTYDIHGAATHTHSVTLTAADFTALSGNNSVTKTSTTTEAHSHSVAISCA